jgi:hypothetical protein
MGKLSLVIRRKEIYPMPSQNERIFILFTQEEVDKIKKGLPVSLYDEETGKQTVFMTEEGYKEMNDWWNGPPD